jgi:hypothetical protein
MLLGVQLLKLIMYETSVLLLVTHINVTNYILCSFEANCEENYDVGDKYLMGTKFSFKFICFQLSFLTELSPS